MAHQNAQAGALDEAIAGYRAALEVVKDRTVAVDLAVALLKKGEAEEVVRLLAGETDPLARYQVALARSKLGRHDEARAALQQVVEAKPEFVEAWYQLGVEWLALGKAAEAERALRKAAALRPDDAGIRLAWAEALQQIGKIAEARAQRQVASRLPK